MKRARMTVGLHSLRFIGRVGACASTHTITLTDSAQIEIVAVIILRAFTSICTIITSHHTTHRITHHITRRITSRITSTELIHKMNSGTALFKNCVLRLAGAMHV